MCQRAGSCVIRTGGGNSRDLAVGTAWVPPNTHEKQPSIVPHNTNTTRRAFRHVEPYLACLPRKLEKKNAVAGGKEWVISILLCSVRFPQIASLKPGYILTCASAVKRSKILQTSPVPSMSAFSA